ncbi:MAG: dadA 2 [Sphingomonas bacterium]|uniref:FAD-dependent oxidoreductase n=1 Tax=Sphingomonas bacterium TaxID=1895847 RepID=UPI002608BB8B|nr:FAD-dependent oxidoreductase [Sphingomonas bacterium]MDB5694973.1 dadA 2 [Sphingomonas bacterium]
MSEAALTRASDVAVLGAGVVGVATAWALARRGKSVIVLDRQGGPAEGASHANGAQLSYAYTDALGSPAMLRKLPSLMRGGDPAFQIRRGFDPAFWRWGLDFLRNCTAPRFANNTIEALRLAAESRAAMNSLLERHSIDFGHATAGKIHLHYDQASFSAARGLMALKAAHGGRQEALTSAEANAVEPALADVPNLVGAIYSPGDEVGDPYRFSTALIALLERTYDVQSRFRCDVADLRLEPGGVRLIPREGESVVARHVIFCLGTEGAPLLRKLGLAPPIWPMKGYSFTAELGPSAPAVSITDTARKIVFCRLDGRMRIAGLAELGATDPSVDEDRLQFLLRTAREALPQAADYESASAGWAGLRPMSPSSLPVISRPRPEVVLNLGHGMLGWTLAMGAAERAAALLE